MRNTREVLLQKWVLKKRHREVASSDGVSLGGVARVLERATVAALTWEEVQGLDDGSLEKALFGERPMAGAPQRDAPDPSAHDGAIWLFTMAEMRSEVRSSFSPRS